MSQSIDNTVLRTLAMVTKTAKSPEGLLEKVIVDEVNLGLGDEIYEDARMEEQQLFEFHPSLFKIHESIVGVSILANNLVQIQVQVYDSECMRTHDNNLLGQFESDVNVVNALIIMYVQCGHDIRL